jgi:hypothetical protein
MAIGVVVCPRFIAFVDVLMKSRIGRDGVPGDGDSVSARGRVRFGARGVEMVEDEVKLVLERIESSIVGLVMFVIDEIVNVVASNGNGQEISLRGKEGREIVGQLGGPIRSVGCPKQRKVTARGY